jgi:hypothetical protein
MEIELDNTYLHSIYEETAGHIFLLSTSGEKPCGRLGHGLEVNITIYLREIDFFGILTVIVNYSIVGIFGDGDYCVGSVTSERFLNSVYNCCRISGSHSGGYEEFCHLAYNAT